jgi:hypothetical protein
VAQIPTVLGPWLCRSTGTATGSGNSLPLVRSSGSTSSLDLGLPWWRHDGSWFQITPAQFRANPAAYPSHAHRIARADLSHPSHVVRRRERWLILDGIHRLLKADMLGHDAIEVLTLTAADVARIARHR